ncbi:hypothetical protein [Streptomyces sp. NPDC000229]|uniref:hypothetical protein n=1 Tax=Streptomyces sp. NPDC000229 TaxID=3154247 RepID=UPI003332DBBE
MPEPLPAQQTPGWSYLDDHLWHTCEIVADVLGGTVAQRPLLATRAPLAPGERALAVGPATRLTWRAFGNGSYTSSQVVAFGSPAFVIGSLLGNAVGNSVRRRQAARDAQPRWVVDGGGELTVTPRKAHFAGQNTSNELNYTGLDSIDLVGPDMVETSFISTVGRPCTLRLQTLWASLIFVLAALEAFPSHPRLLARGWLPLGFEQRCAAMGRPCKPAAEIAARSRTR